MQLPERRVSLWKTLCIEKPLSELLREKTEWSV
jgi:hypothetical protein